MTATVRRLIVHTVDVPLVRPFITAVRRTDAITAVLVEAVDSDGRSGWGEAAASWRVTGESPASIRAAVMGPLSDAVLGSELDDVDRLADHLAAAVIQNAAARCAVECALHDLAAAASGVPLWAHLGGRTNSVTTDMTLSAASTSELIELAIGHRDAGFRTLKLKVGAGLDDVHSVAAVRDAVGADVSLRVDANQGWTARQAIDIIRDWEDASVGIELVEQPVPARNRDDLAFVTARVQTPILADEAVWTSHDLSAIIAGRMADAVNIKLAKSGGLTEARRMIALAAANDIGVLIGCMMESHVGIAAAASLAASLGDPARAHDLDAGLWLAASPVDSGPHYTADSVVLSRAAGTGITGLCASGGRP